jgi:carbamoyl-phosphate synthase small subunit
MRSTTWKLLLEDGTEYRGVNFAAREPVAGEVVFNTGMTGYVEALTDPSYRGQILVLTYPLVGNYGVPPCRPAGAIDRPYESDRIQVQGLVVQSCSSHFSHHTGVRSLSEWLSGEGVAGLTGVDTRALTRRLREHGVVRGWIVPAEMSPGDARNAAREVNMRSEVFREVAPRQVVTYEGGPLRVMLVDCGAKDQIVRSLLERGASVLRVPWHHDLSAHATSVDGVVIGNGPGDPADLTSLTDSVRGLLDHFAGPIFGLCLGHQILALAAGGLTFKLPYGHRGVNQPVQNLQTRRCFITSQNHGYAVDESSMPSDWTAWFRNLNDGTNEGLRALGRPHMSVQFHPEASPGPCDTSALFDDFLSLAGALRRSR